MVTRKFDDKDVDNLIEHFRDKERRKEFFKEYKEIEMLYEIISPDAFLRPFLVALADRAKVVQESFEDRQTSTADALAELLKEIEKNEQSSCMSCYIVSCRIMESCGRT